jgi:hypothetical protein
MVLTPPIEPTMGPATLTSRVMDMDVSSNAMSRMSTSVLGSPSFSASDLMASGIDLALVFRLITICVNVGVLLLRVSRCVRVLMWGNLWRGMLCSNP